MHRPVKNASKKYPWLTSAQVRQLGKGSYFDSEGSLHNVVGCVRCTCIVKSVGKRCKNFAIPGETSCRIHGGNIGRAKQGKQRLYSAFIEDSTLKGVYESAFENEEVQGISEELSLLRMLLANLLANTKDLNNIKGVKEVAKVIGEVRALVKECTSAEIRMGQLIDIGKVVVVVKALADIVAKYVKDEETIERISKEFDNVLWPAPLASTPQPVRKTPSREVPRLPGKIQ